MTATIAIQPALPYKLRLAALSLAMLLPSLGTSIANVALPTIAESFSSPFGVVQWVIIIYLLSVTSLIVGVGRLGDILGRRRFLLGGIGIFTIASAFCVVAPSLWALVAARGVQGLGAAIMIALTIASVSDIMPANRTGSAMGLLGSVSAGGTALGPSLGGALIAVSNWQAVFVLLIFFGVVSALFCWKVLPADTADSRKAFIFDGVGMVLLAMSLGAYALAMSQGSVFFGPTNAIFAAMAVMGIATFVAHELHTEHPLVQMQLLRNRSLSVGLISNALVSTIVMATLVVGPFYLSGFLDLSPAKVGLVMLVGPAVSALTGGPGGRLVDLYGTYAMAIAGLSATAIGSIGMAILPIFFDLLGYVSSLMLITAGYAIFQAANNTAVMSDAPSDGRGLISALLGLSRNLGLITGSSAMGIVFAWGSKGVTVLGLGAGGEGGLALTFVTASVLAGVAVAITLKGQQRNKVRS